MNLYDRSLVLRAVEPSDADTLYAMLADPDLESSVIGWSGPVSLASQDRWIRNIQPHEFRFMVEYEGSPAGMVRIDPVDFKNRTGTVNIKLVPGSRGRGIGRKALNLLLRYMFDELGLEVAVADVLEGNRASRALFKSLGFVQEGVLRARIFKGGARHSVVMYSLLRSEFRSSTGPQKAEVE
ncbi:GNAT family N-acetyltransferase [Flaviflexus huanghaiensis]|uniref:GNAT family N-acetyltransferase n=1 Tax=Flaviflexus huanghaiensis TaxID=1111473 RepID=UPI0015FE2BEB|nr:GNAT family protein [Flaviflexus huanghaiensis]